jgi:phenylacetate-coenzyme A ligase PaaK-like adenylate-forming protein
VPLLNRESLFEATRSKPNGVCVGPIGGWFLGYNRFDIHEWYPYSNEDFLSIASAFSRLCNTVGLRNGDVVLTVMDTPPRPSSFIPFLWTRSSKSENCNLEFINASMEWYDSLSMSWITFMQKRRPTALLATKRNAFALADKLQASGTNVKTVLPNLRVNIFIEDSTPSNIEPDFASETFEVYSPTEHMSFWSECKVHSGIHAWLDGCIPEILPTGGGEAKLLSQSVVGAVGELILTSFVTALPLIRYRTGKMVRVESVGQCSCGANHPKISLINRD